MGADRGATAKSVLQRLESLRAEANNGCPEAEEADRLRTNVRQNRF